ncbi:MAG: hypothetical protein PHC84_05585 [Clostridia bacterium]|nr:hypothetical protein [Clostridia bacterium]
MKKPSKKTLFIALLSLGVAALLTASTFLGIFLYRRFDPETRYLRAEADWSEAEEKKAYDDIAIEIVLGKMDNTLTAVAQATGIRTYDGDEFSFDYDIDLVYKEMNISVLKLKFLLNSEGGNTTVKITKVSGFIDFEGFQKTLTQEDLKGVDISMNRTSLYDTKDISIDREYNYSIEGRQAFDYMLDTLSAVIGEVINIDLSDALENRANFSRVRGQVTFGKAFRIAKITSTQSISAYISWEEADEIIAGIDDIPPKLLEIYQTKKIVVENVPIIGTYTLDLAEILEDAILANIRVIGDTRFEITKK